MHVGNGLEHMRARFYDSGSGRFLSEDPLGIDGGDLNLYTYVLNEATGWIDPSGMSSVLGMVFGGGSKIPDWVEPAINIPGGILGPFGPGETVPPDLKPSLLVLKE